MNVSAHIVVPDAAAACAWYEKAFGAREQDRIPLPGGKVVSARIAIGGRRGLTPDRRSILGRTPRPAGRSVRPSLERRAAVAGRSARRGRSGGGEGVRRRMKGRSLPRQAPVRSGPRAGSERALMYLAARGTGRASTSRASFAGSVKCSGARLPTPARPVDRLPDRFHAREPSQ